VIARHDGQFAMISTSVDEGRAAVRLIRYAVDPADGWWFLAADDLPRPKALADTRMLCLHCIIESLDPEIGSGMVAAKVDAQQTGRPVGLAVWEAGTWSTGDEALDLLP
jgi:hypothetical protein